MDADVGFDEVNIHAIVNPTELGRRMVQCAIFHGWQRFGEATTFAWLERRSGKYLQSNPDYHGTKAVTAYLGGLAITPLGFGTKPTKTGYDFHKEYESVFGPPLRRIQPVQPLHNVADIAIDFDSLRANFEPMGLCPNGFTDDVEKRAASWDTRPDLQQHFVQQVEPIELIIGPAIFDRDVTALDES
jgi:hypothetical protein